MAGDLRHDVPVTGSDHATAALESQLRECFARVVYSHKTHEKCADFCLGRLAAIKTWQIVLAAVTTGSLLTDVFDVFGLAQPGSLIAALASTTLLALNTYTKDYELGEVAQKHREAATQLWKVRESYLSFLTDVRVGDMPIAAIRDKRDALQGELAAIYTGSPATNGRAYEKARRALQQNEELTFSDKEIDQFLPSPLHKKA